ncbi:MAG: ArsA family ATPase [Actinobacteria bacterium]|nr:ArsA family ATPase [Actinomycetota bacterium]
MTAGRLDLLDRRLLFFTGKGGVGKTSVAAAAAALGAERGKRVLLVEVDAKGNLGALFDHPPIGFGPMQVRPNVHVMQMRTDESLREYLRLHVRVPALGGIGPLANVLEFVANAAPGVKEILTVGKICWEVHESVEGRAPWDLVVVDAAASGHVIAQLDAPRAIQELVQVGRVRTQTEWMIELLAAPEITALNVVTTPEELPVSETIELVGRAREELDVPLGVVIANRVLPEPLTRGDDAIVTALRLPDSAAILDRAVGSGAVGVLDALDLAAALRASRAPHLERLRQSVDLPIVNLPALFGSDPAQGVVDQLAAALAEELGT